LTRVPSVIVSLSWGMVMSADMKITCNRPL
jgi:hypothetical protein